MANDYVVQGGSGAASGALMGAQLGGPYGALAGGAIGLGVGLLGASGAKKAREAQERAIREQEIAQEKELGRRAKGAAAARTAFGDVWSLAPTSGWGKGKHTGISFDPAKHMDRAKTLLRHGELAGGLESEAMAARDAGQNQLADAAQQARVAQRAAIGQRGLMGSSLDVSARQSLLGQYAGNRANIASAAEATREGGWNALRARQSAYENAALGGANIGSQLNALRTASTIAGARAQMPYATFANLLNTGTGIADAAMRSEAQGGLGVQALGLPALGVGPKGKANTPTGATVSGG